MSFKRSIEEMKKETMNLPSNQNQPEGFYENISDYVAQLQLHMALQSRKLLPNLTDTKDGREEFLHQTQANVEKLVSRQLL